MLPPRQGHGNAIDGDVAPSRCHGPPGAAPNMQYSTRPAMGTPELPTAQGSLRGVGASGTRPCAANFNTGGLLARAHCADASRASLPEMHLGDVLSSADFFEHQISLTELADRRPVFIERSSGKSVLHVGCCDVPVFDPDSNLHLALAAHTDRLDGLDVSEAGISVLRQYVDGQYFTDPAQITREYDLVLAPEVIEHTPDAHAFLRGLFSVRATQYLVSAPHFQWFTKTRLDGGKFHETVHPDHRAWYSPYTLLNALRPFIDEARDDIEVFLFKSTGSVAIAVTKPFVPEPFAGRQQAPAGSVEAALQEAERRLATGNGAAALGLLEATRARFPDSRLLHAELALLLGTRQAMEALRRGVAWLRAHPDDDRCLLLCADAAAAHGELELAEQWRSSVRSRQ